MTVSSTINRVAYNGNGATTAFPTTFPFYDATDFVVVKVTIADGTEAVQTLNSDYTVSGGGGLTGTVTMAAAPSSAYRIVIYRDPPVKQLTDLTNGDGFDVEESVEKPLDKQAFLHQRSREISERALRQPEGDSAAIDAIPAKVMRAGKFLAFDSNGDPIAAAGTSASLGPVSAFVNTLLDDADALTFLATLGLTVSAYAKTVLDDANAAAARATLGIGAAPFVVGLTMVPNSGAPNDKVDINLASIVLANSSGDTLAFLNQSSTTITVDVTAAGSVANGRDQAGAFSAGSWIHFWAISDGTNLRGLASASSTAPTLPSGYTFKAYLGATRYDGSSHLVKTRLYGAWAYYEAAQQALSTGTPATSATSIGLSALVPPNANVGQIEIDLTGSTTNGNPVAFVVQLQTVSGAVFAQARTNAGPITGTQAPFNQNDHIVMPILSQAIYYLATNTTNVQAQTLVINVLGYKLPNGGE